MLSLSQSWGDAGNPSLNSEVRMGDASVPTPFRTSPVPTALVLLFSSKYLTV